MAKTLTLQLEEANARIALMESATGSPDERIAELEGVISRGREANEDLSSSLDEAHARIAELEASGGGDPDARVAELLTQLNDANARIAELSQDTIDDSDYETCSHFADKLGRKYDATPVLRRLAKDKGLRPCSAPAGKKATGK